MNLITNKSKEIKNKTGAMTIAILFILSMAASAALVPSANAHSPAWNYTTYCYCAPGNHVIGIGQPLTIVFWVNTVPPTGNGAYGDRWSYSMDITMPDGTTTTLQCPSADPGGTGYTVYTPTKVGNYTFVAHFKGDVITGYSNNAQTGFPIGQNINTISGAANVNDSYLPSTSNAVTVTVTQAPIAGWPEAPLPTSYWTVPLNGANRQTYVLVSNWLSGAAQNFPAGAAGGCTTAFNYGTGPESAHIMWTTPMWAGGWMGAQYGDIGYETAHYEGLAFTPPIILNGKIYYNVQSLPREEWVCVDLYTGKTDYVVNCTGGVTNYQYSVLPNGTLVGGSGFDYSGSITGGSLAFGQIFAYDSPNQHGGFPYLWSTTPPAAQMQPATPSGTWYMYDQYTGRYICSIANVTQTEVRGTRSVTTGATGTSVYGTDGSIMRYSIVNLGPSTTNIQDYLQIWSTSQVLMSKVPNANDYWMYRPYLNYTFNGAGGFLLNASIPAVQGSLIDVRQDQFVIGGLIGTYDGSGNVATQGNLWCLSLKQGQQGTLLWNITFTPPSQVGNKTISMTSVDPEDGVIIFSCTQTMQYWGYSLASGQQIWGPTAPAEEFDYYGMSTNIYQGMLLACGYGGVLRAYNVATGKLLWTYTASGVGFESYYGGYYPLGIVCIADGKIYTTSSEHSPTQPLWRGSDLRCVNASNGVELWKCLFWGMGMSSGSGAAIADGYIVGLNAYDNQLYCFGKGPSGTTVEAPMTAVAAGTNMIIRGSVTDQCVGAIALAQKEGMMNGVAAVSDDSMQAWMEYLYEGQIMPNNATGVPVSIDSIDPNGNNVHLGDAVSDSSGLYSLAWLPPNVPGKYTVIATFAGSKSFYSSKAETALYVSQAAAPASPQIKPTAAPTPTNTIAPTTAPTATIAPTPSPVVIPPTSAAPTATYIAIGAIVIVIIAMAAALALRKRK